MEETTVKIPYGAWVSKKDIIFCEDEMSHEYFAVKYMCESFNKTPSKFFEVSLWDIYYRMYLLGFIRVVFIDENSKPSMENLMISHRKGQKISGLQKEFLNNMETLGVLSKKSGEYVYARNGIVLT